jgi:glycosyltransferase involved in cell wall biosynthesis
MLSVIIPTLDAERHLGKQLERFAGQTFRGEWELLVSDNGSTDGTRAVAERFRGRIPGLRVVDSGARKGSGAARNIAAAAAAGDVLLFADADDLVSTRWVEAYADALAAADFCTGPVTMFEDDDKVPDLSMELPEPMRLYMEWKPAALGCNFAMRRSVFERLGGFDESFINAQDLDLSWRAQIAGVILAWVPGARVAKRQRESFRTKYRQHRGFGVADIMLVRRFGKHGLTEPRALTLRKLAWSILNLPDLLSPRRRLRWAAVAGRTVGRMRAAVLQR